jgi:DNA-binding XRE family transcriptional regulator
MEDRMQKQLDRFPPEERVRIEAALAEARTPERRAARAAAMEAIDREVRETGGITAEDGTFHRVRVPAAPEFGRRLKALREARGLSVEEVVKASGIERSALFKLEGGKTPNPTVGTLERYARALGGRIRIEFEPTPEVVNG